MLGKRIRELRRKRGISLKELSFNSGICLNSLINIENGKMQQVDNKELLKIVDSLLIKNKYDYAALLKLNACNLKFKAYNVGIPKTGTTSICGMFAKYRSAHEFLFEDTVKMILNLKNNIISKSTFEIFLKQREAIGHLEMDSSSFNHLYFDFLKKEFNCAKFIFTIRDCYSWVESVVSMYRRGDPARGYPFEGQNWMDEYTLFLFGVEKALLENEELFDTNYYENLDKLFYNWAKWNKSILTKLPPKQSLVVRTHEISMKTSEISDFIGVPSSKMLAKNSHLYSHKNKANFYYKKDPLIIEKCVKRHCSSLMNEIFPEFNLDTFREYH